MALRNLQRISLLVLALAAGAPSQALQLAYEPVGLGWSSAEFDRASSGVLAGVVAQARRTHQLGCSRYCDRLARLFGRLVVVARQQTPRAQALPWSLVVVRDADLHAMALAGGQVIVSEAFIDRKRLGADALAFVLAHEMAHSILEHQRQALTFARMLLPRQVPRSVADVYAEMDFDLGLLKAMEPVLQQGEFEADELGLLMSSWAGFDPRHQLEFLAAECAANAPVESVVETHPPACARLARLRERLPLAQRLLARQRQAGDAGR